MASDFMLASLEQLLLVLAIGSAVAISAKRINVPFNVALVVVGLLLVLMNALPETPMEPHVVLMVFLPVLVFQGALMADAPPRAPVLWWFRTIDRRSTPSGRTGPGPVLPRT